MSTTKPKVKAEPSTEPFPFPTAENHPPADPEQYKTVAEEPTEMALDHGVEESFPASDPVSVTVTKVVPPKKKPG
ncbi:MAG: hypothetical protein WKG52_12565 [Variovorax sp.]